LRDGLVATTSNGPPDVPLFERAATRAAADPGPEAEERVLLIGVFIGVTFLIGAWSIVNGMNVYMTDKFAGTLVGVNTFHLRQRPNVNFNVDDSTWPRGGGAPASSSRTPMPSPRLTVPAITAWYSEAGRRRIQGEACQGITLEGTTERYFEIMTLKIEQGRPFTAQEAKAGATVVVLDTILAKAVRQLSPLGAACAFTGSPTR